ncbi:MAG: hypothetical protein VX109_04300 [Planctomycetota bacterium]|nr:hypothetical protein [Planctomycetota bacterium]MEC8354908.1 hypothetical protein [Planctomycetota bacterium]
MTNLDRLPSTIILTSLTTLLVACGGKEEVVQAPPPKPKPVVVQPEPVVVKELSGTELIAKFNLDPRLMLADDMAGTEQERKKVLTFFNAILEGDMRMLRSMVSSDDALQFEALADLGGFDDEVLAGVDTIELHFGTDEEEGGSAVLAWFATGKNDEVQMWTFETVDSKFKSQWGNPEMVDRLHSADPVAVWYALNRQEQALAELPDEVIKLQAYLDEDSEGEVYSSSSSPSLGGSSPANSRRPIGRRRKPPFPG